MNTDLTEGVSETANLRWVSAALTDVGERRSINEDAYLARPQSGFWLVADGMGGHEGGAYASQTVVDAVGMPDLPESLAGRTRTICFRLQQANHLLVDESEHRGKGMMGSTVAALLLGRRHAVRIWAGDSRVYRLRHGKLDQLTRDHSWVEESVALGVMDRDTASEYPHANEITRAVGADRHLVLAVEMGDLSAGDRYLLCSDGLYGEVEDERLRAALAEEDLDVACSNLVLEAKRNGGRDNITVIIVHTQ